MKFIHDLRPVCLIGNCSCRTKGPDILACYGASHSVTGSYRW